TRVNRSRSSSPSAASVAWQSRQYRASKGRTSRVNSTSRVPNGSGSAALVAGTNRLAQQSRQLQTTESTRPRGTSRKPPRSVLLALGKEESASAACQGGWGRAAGDAPVRRRRGVEDSAPATPGSFLGTFLS